jgi:hypothetical protein
MFNIEDITKQHENGEWTYPMLRAFHVLNLSNGNSAQSASSSVVTYDVEKWAGIERVLNSLPSRDFVSLALGELRSETIEAAANPELREWLLTYV